MSYAYTQRKKVIRRLKNKFGDKWYQQYKFLIDEIWKEQHPFIGTLQDVMDAQRGIKI